MKPDALQASLAALEVLIQDELASGAPARYVRITKLCDMAHRLVQMGATRVKDVAVDDGALIQQNPVGNVIYGGEYAENVMNVLPMAMPRVGNAQPDIVDLIREMLMSLHGMQAKQVVALPPTIDPVYDCQRLIELRDNIVRVGRSTTVIDAKLDAALAALERTPDDSASLVSPVILRGHSPGGDGDVRQAEDVSPRRREAVGDGEVGPPTTGPNGAQEGLAHLPGDAHQLHGDCHRSADREGRQGARVVHEAGT